MPALVFLWLCSAITWYLLHIAWSPDRSWLLKPNTFEFAFSSPFSRYRHFLHATLLIELGGNRAFYITETLLLADSHVGNHNNWQIATSPPFLQLCLRDECGSENSIIQNKQDHSI